MKISPKDAGSRVVVPIEQARALAKPKPARWRDFKRLVADADELEEYYGTLMKADSQTVAELERDAEWCQELVAKSRAGLARFDPPENYEDDDEGEDVLCQAYIAKRIGVMVASFPNANPACPDGYVRMLIEHVSATKASALSLESACREIVETQKFAPAISEVMEVIAKHIDEWSQRRFVIREVENRRRGKITALVEREEEKRKQARELEISRATNAVQSAIKATRNVAGEIAATETALATLRQRHAAAEKHESECLRKLRALTATEEEREAEAAAKANSAGCAELELEPEATVH
jgi:hypothetical protein